MQKLRYCLSLDAWCLSILFSESDSVKCVFMQLLIKEYKEEIKALRLELAMHDTLVTIVHSDRLRFHIIPIYVQ